MRSIDATHDKRMRLKSWEIAVVGPYMDSTGYQYDGWLAYTRDLWATQASPGYVGTVFVHANTLARAKSAAIRFFRDGEDPGSWAENNLGTARGGRLMQITIDLSKQFLHDVFVTAMEGGIGYWSECDKYHWHKGQTHDDALGFGADLDGFHAVIREVENEHTENNRYRIDAEVLTLGLQRVIESFPGAIELVCAIVTQDAGEIDSTGADIIVQYGLFGEVRYG